MTLAALCLVAVLHAGIAPQTASCQPRQAKSVTWVNPNHPKYEGLEHRTLASASLSQDVGYVVWTPPEFDNSGNTRYPVIYFLHGAGGNESSDSKGLSSMIAAGIRRGVMPPAICVFPNGGLSGYRGDVETMIVDELIPLIDETYPTRPEATSRVAVGFSMGGAGSVRLSLLHPTLFCAAGSWGGALSFRGNEEKSPLLPAASVNATTLLKNEFSALLINGDKDRPEAFKLLDERFQRLNIPNKTVVLEDTRHNLGLYHRKSGDVMIEFLGRQLNRSRSGRPIEKRVK